MINTSIALLGVALQNGATPAAAPKFQHGLTGGGLIKPERKVDQKNVACGLRASASNSSYVDEVNMGIDFECMAYADAFALYAAAALGNIVSTPAADAGYYKHVITLGSTLPSLTFWGQLGDTSQETVHRATGCKMDKLSLDFEGNDSLSVGVTAAGIDASLFGTWAGDAEPSCFDGYFVPTNGTFLIDTASQTPHEQVITKGSLELSNSLKAHRGAGRVIASMLTEGKLKTSVKTTVTVDDWQAIRELLTGSATGTTVTSQVVYGSAAWSFTHSQDPKCTMDVVFQHVPWQCDMPEVDPDGSAADIEFSADDIGVASKTGSPVTITIVNKVESYTA